ncbi:hypothetical protein BDN70DRAFT_157028 [Pholiota conissans]|uniref:Uncharacterized protein n=1 Tax=Pholiota conissans TaxID=109636 RepID=A0A9P6CRW9_9AGAR|nr:hypothetical protein BDN70DRAFT_157028 [Pholiota conissans]
MTRLSWPTPAPLTDMAHKLVRRGGIASVVESLHGELYNSNLYQKLASIPPPLPAIATRLLMHVNSEIVDIRDQTLNLLEFVIIGDGGLGRGQGFFSATKFAVTKFSKDIANEEFRNHVAEYYAPRLVGWYLQYKATTDAIREPIDDFKRSRSILDRTPKEAARINQAERMNAPPPNRRSQTSGTIFHFYSSFERGRYGPTVNEPDFITVMNSDDSRGIQLSKLRKALGVESVAVITDRPFRQVFEPANEDWLSPLALLDLTKQNTLPLRVFENRVTHATKVKRVIREPVFLVMTFIISLLRLMIGFPEDTAYIQLLYGSLYANAFHAVGFCTSRVNWAIRTTVKYSAAFCVVVCMVIFVIASAFVRNSARAARAVVTSLDVKGYLILFGVIWFGLAEYFSMAH